METTHTEQDGFTVFHLHGRLDPTTAPDLEKTIDTVITDGSIKLLFDFSKLDYLSSAGLRVVLGTMKRIDREGGTMVLCAMQGYVKEIFDVSGFSSLIPIEDTIQSALDRFA